MLLSRKCGARMGGCHLLPPMTAAGWKVIHRTLSPWQPILQGKKSVPKSVCSVGTQEPLCSRGEGHGGVRSGAGVCQVMSCS